MTFKHCKYNVEFTFRIPKKYHSRKCKKIKGIFASSFPLLQTSRFFSRLIIELTKKKVGYKMQNRVVSLFTISFPYVTSWNFFFDGSVHWFMALYKYGTLGYPNPNVLNENLDSRHK